MPVYERSVHLEVERDGERIFVQPHDERQHWIVLEGSAAGVWDALEAPAAPAEVATRLAERYAGDPAQMTHDLEAVLAEWAQRGLVVVRS